MSHDSDRLCHLFGQAARFGRQLLISINISKFQSKHLVFPDCSELLVGLKQIRSGSLPLTQCQVLDVLCRQLPRAHLAAVIRYRACQLRAGITTHFLPIERHMRFLEPDDMPYLSKHARPGSRGMRHPVHPGNFSDGLTVHLCSNLIIPLCYSSPHCDKG